MMSNTTEPSDGSPEDLSGYAYYSFGLSVGVLLLFAFVTFLLYFCTRRNALNTSQHLNHNNHPSFALRSINVVQENPNNSPQLYGVDEATLKTYPVLLYSELKRNHKGGSGGGDLGRVVATCSICLGDFGESEWLRELPDCHHLFHRKCIDMWLRMNSSCPLCRTSPLPTPVSTPLVEVAPLARSGAS